MLRDPSHLTRDVYDAPTADLVGYSADHFLDLAKNFFFKTRWDRELKLVRGYPIQ